MKFVGKIFATVFLALVLAPMASFAENTTTKAIVCEEFLADLGDSRYKSISKKKCAGIQEQYEKYRNNGRNCNNLSPEECAPLIVCQSKDKICQNNIARNTAILEAAYNDPNLFSKGSYSGAEIKKGELKSITCKPHYAHPYLQRTKQKYNTVYENFVCTHDDFSIKKFPGNSTGYKYVTAIMDKFTQDCDMKNGKLPTKGAGSYGVKIPLLAQDEHLTSVRDREWDPVITKDPVTRTSFNNAYNSCVSRCKENVDDEYFSKESFIKAVSLDTSAVRDPTTGDDIGMPHTLYKCVVTDCYDGYHVERNKECVPNDKERDANDKKYSEIIKSSTPRESGDYIRIPGKYGKRTEKAIIDWSNKARGKGFQVVEADVDGEKIIRCSEKKGGGDPSYMGIVIDAQTKKGIGGAEVTKTCKTNEHTTNKGDRKGEFFCKKLSSPKVIVKADGYQDSKEITLVSGWNKIELAKQTKNDKPTSEKCKGLTGNELKCCKEGRTPNKNTGKYCDGDAPGEDKPGSDKPGADKPGSDKPGSDKPGSDKPGSDKPGSDKPGADKPGSDKPGADKPGSDKPGSDKPGSDKPGSDKPGSDKPGSDKPGSDKPGSDKPGSDKPGSDKPGSDKPGSDKPGSDKPGSDKPGADKPGSDKPGEDKPGEDKPGENKPDSERNHEDIEAVHGRTNLLTPEPVKPNLKIPGMGPNPDNRDHEDIDSLPGGIPVLVPLPKTIKVDPKLANNQTQCSKRTVAEQVALIAAGKASEDNPYSIKYCSKFSSPANDPDGEVQTIINWWKENIAMYISVTYDDEKRAVFTEPECQGEYCTITASEVDVENIEELQGNMNILTPEPVTPDLKIPGTDPNPDNIDDKEKPCDDQEVDHIIEEHARVTTDAQGNKKIVVDVKYITCTVDEAQWDKQCPQGYTSSVVESGDEITLTCSKETNGDNEEDEDDEEQSADCNSEEVKNKIKEIQKAAVGDGKTIKYHVSMEDCLVTVIEEWKKRNIKYAKEEKLKEPEFDKTGPDDDHIITIIVKIDKECPPDSTEDSKEGCICNDEDMKYDKKKNKCVVDELKKKQKEYEEAKANEQSKENRTLTALSVAATGIGGMELAMGLSQQAADAYADQSMAAYIATMRCTYGDGKQVKAGPDEIELPGGNSSELMSLRNEYFTLAKDLKERKDALGMKPGIESEEIIDKAQTGLYDDESLGIDSGAYASLYRAQMLGSEADQSKIDDERKASKNRVIAGGVLVGAGVIGGILGDSLINGKLGEKIKANKEKRKAKSSSAIDRKEEIKLLSEEAKKRYAEKYGTSD